MFEVKDYNLGCLMIRDSRVLGKSTLCMLGKGFKSKLIENKSTDYSANTVLYTQNRG